MVLKLASVEKFGARGLETEEITGFSNAQSSTFQPQTGLEGIELQDSQQSSMANSIGFERE